MKVPSQGKLLKTCRREEKSHRCRIKKTQGLRVRDLDHLDARRADKLDGPVGPVHQGGELWVVVLEPATVDQRADNVGHCIVDWLGGVKRLPWAAGSRRWRIQWGPEVSLSDVQIPLKLLKTSTRWEHSSVILSSHDFLPIPKSLRLDRAKRLISRHESPLENKTPDPNPSESFQRRIQTNCSCFATTSQFVCAHRCCR